MGAKFIVNQDRDQIYRFNPYAVFYTLPKSHEGVFMGINLMMGNDFLGTFDSPEDAVEEIRHIFNHTGELYAVQGFSDWGADT